MGKQRRASKFAKVIAFVLTLSMVISMSAPVVKTNAATSTLLNTYGSYFGKSGAAVTYSQLTDATTLNFIKTHYNSITMGNEMKPDFVLGWNTPTTQTVATAKTNGYYIPSNYTESTVPVINYTTVDAILKICYDNGLKLRGHTLVWHAQTPDWFFRTGYSTTGAYVSQSVMNARLEMYIKSFMKHVHTSSYGSVVYAWDVVNEYVHATTSGWSAVYGSGLGNTPGYVKSAFQYASDYLTSIGKRSSVSLFYNDFNEWLSTSDIVSLVNFINSSSKLCDGIGMQTHMSTTYPTVSAYLTAMQTFVNTGLEVQVTEIDVGNTSASEQATYVYNLLKGIIGIKKAGGNITGITWWGVADPDSWRADEKPLLFSSVGVAKASYTSALQAYTDSYCQAGVTELFSGSATGSNYATPVGVKTTHGGGGFCAPAVIKTGGYYGGYFYVEYTGTQNSIALVLQSWSGGTSWATVQPTATGTSGNGNYYAKFSYAACTAAYGSDFSLLDKVLVGTGSGAITVKLLQYKN